MTHTIRRRSVLHLLGTALGYALCLALGTSGAAAQTPAPAGQVAFLVAYFEVAPASAAKTAALLKQYRADALKEDGALDVLILQQQDRTTHFALHETWRSQAAVDAHVMSAATKAFRSSLEMLRITPYDERQLHPLTDSVRSKPVPAGARVVLTHADASPVNREKAEMLLKTVTTPSRAEAGSVRYDVGQQNMPLNHFTMLEIWSDQRAFESHQVTPHTREFRREFGPLSGALYDERVYTVIK